MGSAATACPANASVQTAAATKMRSAHTGLGADPVEIALQSMAYGDSDNLGKFVGMGCEDRRLDALIEPAAGLDGNGHLLRSFDLSAPVIH